MSQSPFTIRVIELIQAIPYGRVATYGQIAALAGNRRAARQVARILHSCSRNEGLPWHRVVNKAGRIALDPDRGGDRQQRLLAAEGVRLDNQGRIDFSYYLWSPEETVHA